MIVKRAEIVAEMKITIALGDAISLFYDGHASNLERGIQGVGDADESRNDLHILRREAWQRESNSEIAVYEQEPETKTF